MLYDEVRYMKMEIWSEEILEEFRKTREHYGNQFVKDAIGMLLEVAGLLERESPHVLIQGLGRMAKLGIATVLLAERKLDKSLEADIDRERKEN